MTVRRTIILLGIASVVVSGIQAQHRCDFDSHISRWDPGAYERIEQQIQSSLNQLHKRSEATLPVVFHIVYRTDEQNISDLQIRSQLDILNRDFAFMSDNVRSVPPEFSALGGDTGIRFCLASKDPNGNSTSGITRSTTQIARIGTHQQSNGRYSVHYSQYGGADGWPPDRYINIWVADMDGLLGAATFPGLSPYPEEDGVVIDPRYVGATGLAARSDPFDRGHTLTHEMGHYFGLYHIWGEGQGSCNTDDLVDDTPEQETFYLDCPEYPQFSCGSSDMFMNFMDFTNDRCLALFTRGQATRMMAALNGPRASLLDNATACAPPDNGKIHFDDVLIYYAPLSRQIIIALDKASTTPREVFLFSIDGRQLYNTLWSEGGVFWLNADHFPSGVYVVRLESEGESAARKIVIN